MLKHQTFAWISLRRRFGLRSPYCQATGEPADTSGTSASDDLGGFGLQITPIRPSHQQVSAQLEAMIVAGAFPADARLPSEKTLAEEFGISRMTVRETVKSFVADKLVYAVRGSKGRVFVASSDLASVRDHLQSSIEPLDRNRAITGDELLEAREALESRAARLAALHRSRQLAVLEEVLAADLAVPPDDRDPGVHNEFHERILQCAGNRMLELLPTPVFRVVVARFSTARQPVKTWQRIDADHRRLLECIRDGDGDGAVIAMTEHLEHLRPFHQRMDADMPASSAAPTPSDGLDGVVDGGCSYFDLKNPVPCQNAAERDSPAGTGCACRRPYPRCEQGPVLCCSGQSRGRSAVRAR